MPATPTDPTPLQRLAPDRRHDPRVAVDFHAELESDDFPGALRVGARDLSVGGICVATPSPIPTAGIHAVRFSGPEGSLRVPAEARWQTKRGEAHFTGLCFQRATPEIEDALWSMVVLTGRRVADFLLNGSKLAGLGRDDALGLAHASRLRVIETGTWLYRQGEVSEDGDSILVLMEGEVRLQVRAAERERTHGRLLPGHVFGGLTLLAGIAPPESAVAVLPSRLLEVDAAAYSYLLHDRPWLAHRLAFAVMGAYANRVDALLASIA